MAKQSMLPSSRSSGFPLLSLRHEVDRLFDNWLSEPHLNLPSLWEGEGMMFWPHLDISETNKEIHVSAELPGMDLKDIHLQATHDRLTLEGEKKKETEEKGENFFRHERSFGSFHREIPLSTEIDEKKVRANFKDGVLRITLPKTKVSKNGSKGIPIKAG